MIETPGDRLRMVQALLSERFGAPGPQLPRGLSAWAACDVRRAIDNAEPCVLRDLVKDVIDCATGAERPF